jgi:anti-anti-sigma factor
MDTALEMEMTDGGSRGRIAVLNVQGKLDATTAPKLLERCAQVQANGQDLVLSLSGISFLGSSGVGAMLVLVEQFAEQAGKVHFAALSEPVRAVVELLDLAQYLPLYATVNDAVAAMGG